MGAPVSCGSSRCVLRVPKSPRRSVSLATVGMSLQVVQKPHALTTALAAMEKRACQSVSCENASRHGKKPSTASRPKLRCLETIAMCCFYSIHSIQRHIAVLRATVRFQKLIDLEPSSVVV